MIGEKIVKIMSEIKPIQKTELDEEKNYKFAKSEDIIAMVKPLLEKYKVIIIPLKILNHSTQGNKVFINMKYQFIDVTDPNKDCIEVEAAGSGFDEKGRGTYGALTGAYRYAIQQVFAIPIIDEVKDKSEELNKNDENSINETQNNDCIDDEEIQNIDIEDIDKLFTAEKIV